MTLFRPFRMRQARSRYKFPQGERAGRLTKTTMQRLSSRTSNAGGSFRDAGRGTPSPARLRKEAACLNTTAKGRPINGALEKKLKGKSSDAAVRHTSGRRLNRLPEWRDPESYITKGGRHRLFGMDYNLLQVAAFRRAGGFCECDECAKLPRRLFADWNHHLIEARGELAHNEHGPRKSDELSRVKWMRHECHVRSHNCHGKPCPKKERAA